MKNTLKNPLPEFMKSMLMEVNPSDMLDYYQITINRAGVLLEGKYVEELHLYLLGHNCYHYLHFNAFNEYQHEIESITIRLYR